MAMGRLRRLLEPKKQTVYHWRCSCGAHSRGGDVSEYMTQSRAQRHQLNTGVELNAYRAGERHPLPEVYATEVVID